jgi:hypothetical protein
MWALLTGGTHGKTVTGFEKWIVDEWGFNCSILETTENVDRDADISII